MAKYVDVDTVMSWRPCPRYTRDQIVKLIDGGRGWTHISARRVLNLDIPIQDRLWAVLHKELLSDRQLRLCACAFAASVLRHFEYVYHSDFRPRNALITTLEYELGRCGSAAMDVARDEMWDVVQNTAQKVYEFATHAIAQVIWTAMDDVETAAQDAMWWAARQTVLPSAAKDKQIQIVRDVLDGRITVKELLHELERNK